MYDLAPTMHQYGHHESASTGMAEQFRKLTPLSLKLNPDLAKGYKENGNRLCLIETIMDSGFPPEAWEEVLGSPIALDNPKHFGRRIAEHKIPAILAAIAKNRSERLRIET